ncbi:MAG: adenylate/guanylate cyclase domain-containing protein [Ilumatobacteraceae bacterium]|nr:hypothetical protein [Ilumatobacter sp.]MCO5332294.1 adenylate/guanylate cyclase domain-containing protein [Ilumatobacteraceae bacterium]
MTEVSSTQVEQWQAAGLYDPADPCAVERLELLAWITSQGVGLDAMVAANADGQLISLVSDRTMRPAPTLTANDIAARTGLPLATVQQIRRATGFPSADPAARVFCEHEVQMFELFAAADAFFSRDELLHFIRVMASSFRRVAEAATEMFLRDVEAPLQEGRRDEVTLAKASLAGVQLVDNVTQIFGPLFRMHLQATTTNSRRAGSDDYSSVRLAVGFVDLSGFTTRSAASSSEELLELVVGFESAAMDLVSGQGGRLVKLIGDEVMFTTVTAQEACAVARGLLAWAEENGVRARGGLAHGPVVTAGGDVYGSTVNLASRIADIAVPGEVLVDEGVTRAAPYMEFEPAGRRQLKGFSDPVRLWALDR